MFLSNIQQRSTVLNLIEKQGRHDNPEWTFIGRDSTYKIADDYETNMRQLMTGKQRFVSLFMA